VADGATRRWVAEPAGPGRFYPPTVLTDVRHGSVIKPDEIFGPVGAVVGFAESSRRSRWERPIYGLIPTCSATRPGTIAVAQRIDAGMSRSCGRVSDPAAPSVGRNSPGLGREGSSEGILEFLEEKYLGIGGVTDGNAVSPPDTPGRRGRCTVRKRPRAKPKRQNLAGWLSSDR